MKCTACGRENPPGSLFCHYCGLPAKEAKPNKKRKTGKALLLCGACLLLALAVVAAVWLPKFLGPLTSTTLAARKTLKKGSFSFVFSRSDPNGTTKVQGQVELDLENRQLTLVANLRQNKGVTQEYIIYDRYLMTRRSGGTWSCQDYGAELDEFFDALDSSGQTQDLRTVLKERNLLTLAEGYLDLRKVEENLLPFVMHFNDERWLEEHAGYTRSKKNGTTYHTLEFGMMSFFGVVIEDFRTAFLDEDFYNDFHGNFADVEEDDDTQVLLKVGIRKGVIHHVQIHYGESETELWVEDVGKTQIDASSLKKLLQEVRSQ